MKYYENIRFVYEFESRVREFKRITEPAEPRREQEEDKNKERRNDTSGQPDQKEDRDYSRGKVAPCWPSCQHRVRQPLPGGLYELRQSS